MDRLTLYWRRIARGRPVTTTLVTTISVAALLVGLAMIPSSVLAVRFFAIPIPDSAGGGSLHAGSLSERESAPSSETSSTAKADNSGPLASRTSAAGGLAIKDSPAPSLSGRELSSVPHKSGDSSGTELALAVPDLAGRVTIPSLDDDADRLLHAEHLQRLKAGRERFRQVAGYTATLTKRERVDSTLAEETSFAIKVRHLPFSVYMKWLNGASTGKEALYVDGINANQLLVRLGGFKGRILPAFKVDPFGSLALSESRHPITKLGILALADSLIERRELEIRDGIPARLKREADADCDGRLCAVYISQVTDAARSPVYRKSVQYIDREWNVPIRVANYTWPGPGEQLEGPALDAATLIEYYSYSEIVTDARLTDLDFDRSNAEYHFHR